MLREPKPRRAFTSTGNRTSAGTSAGSHVGGEPIPRSTKKRCASYLSAQRVDDLWRRQQHERAELVARTARHAVVEVGERNDQRDVVHGDEAASAAT